MQLLCRSRALGLEDSELLGAKEYRAKHTDHDKNRYTAGYLIQCDSTESSKALMTYMSSTAWRCVKPRSSRR